MTILEIIQIPIRLAEVCFRLVIRPRCYCRVELRVYDHKVVSWRKRMEFHPGALIGPSFSCSECHIMETL